MYLSSKDRSIVIYQNKQVLVSNSICRGMYRINNVVVYGTVHEVTDRKKNTTHVTLGDYTKAGTVRFSNANGSLNNMFTLNIHIRVSVCTRVHQHNTFIYNFKHSTQIRK